MRVTLISAGMLCPKKADHPFARLHLYLNYGLLAIASELHRRGHAPTVVHGRFEPPRNFVHSLVQSNLLDVEAPLLLSIPSSYALAWSKQFCQFIKEQKPNQKIIVGGRWVVGTDGNWIKKMIPDIDLVVYGLAERRIERLLDPSKWNTVPFCSATSEGTGERPLHNLPILNYALLQQFEDYQPSIEVSRGCGMGCSFCAEKDIPLSQSEAPITILNTIRNLCNQYSNNEIRPYFEASYFRPSFGWARAFQQGYSENGLQVRWRCESRVDGIPPRTLDLLAQSGLKVIDLGLESASARQLRAMKKTREPDTYLKKASLFIRECKRVGVWVKVNILLYPGEDWHSLRETAEWLDVHREYIKGISVGPLVAYRQDITSILPSLSPLGASLVSEDALESTGIGNLHLSREIDHETALSLSMMLCREFMSAQDYFDLKSFSYLPRSYTFVEFQRTLTFINKSSLPFRPISN